MTSKAPERSTEVARKTAAQQAAEPAFLAGGDPQIAKADGPANSITVTALQAFPLQLEAHFAAIPAAFRNWAPPSWEGIPSEPLTAIEQLCHVRDVEVLGYHVRLHRTLNESTPTLASLDTEALAQERSYATQSAEAALAEFRQARTQTLALIAGLSPQQFQRTAVFDGYGPLSLRSLVHYLCSHDQQHLAGLQWLLGKIEAERAQGHA